MTEKDQLLQVETLMEPKYYTLSKKKRIAILLLSVSIAFLYRFDLQTNTRYSCTWGAINETGTENIKMIKHQLQQACTELEALKKQHNDLINRVRNSPRFINKSEMLLRPLCPGLLCNGSIEGYETVRRNIYWHLKELGNYINSKLLLALFDPLNVKTKQDFLSEINNRKRSVLMVLERLETQDGHAAWRHEAARALSALVQRRLFQLQHPTHCYNRRKVLCTLDNCGFGCTAHHIIFCLLFAYATDRTLVVNGVYNCPYSPLSWHKVFHHVSWNCTEIYDDKVWKYATKPEAKVVYLSPFRNYEKKASFPNFRPNHVPYDLAHRIARFNGDPASWWIGQIVKYIFVPQDKFVKLIKTYLPKSNFSSPVVGLHVRRTDKLKSEAKYHELSKYMQQVDEYYAQVEVTRAHTHRRRVYLATDEPRVIKEAVEKYSQYDLLYNSSSAQLAEVGSKRYSARGLQTILVDLYSLASCHYVVCTFSSNICRLVYEMMQIDRDASDSVHSLDHFYYFTVSEANYRIAFRNHTVGASNPHSVDFIKGDIIKVYYDKDQEEYVGTVIRTQNTGTIPWYKTVKLYEVYKFPEYLQQVQHITHTNT